MAGNIQKSVYDRLLLFFIEEIKIVYTFHVTFVAKIGKIFCNKVLIATAKCGKS